MFIVTGGAGFIGSNLVKALEDLEPSSKIVVCDVLGTDEKWQNLVKRHAVWEVISPDMLFEYIQNHAADIKAIFHLGAISSTVEQDADLIMTTNVHLSLALWEWCTTNQVPFIYASSAATYGNGSHGFSDEMDFENLNRLRPLNAYGWSKHFFDERAYKMSLSGYHPPQWVGLKFFNVYGPNEYHKGGQKSVIATFYPQIQENGEIRLFKSTDPQYKDGGQLRDFVWVQDCVDIMLWLYKNPGISGIFNIGTGHARSFNDLALAVFRSLSLSPQIEYIDMPESLAKKYQNFTQANLFNLRKAGYSKDFTSLEDGVANYVQNFLIKEDPYL